MTTPSVNCKPTGEFAASGGCISAVEIHDRPSHWSSLERGDSKAKPERQTFNELALFAGAGGGILAGKLLGWRTVCAVEINDYARRVLLARQDDGSLEPFPIWDDVRTFDGRPWRGIVDVVSGGFPCQDIAVGSSTKTGIEGERSGLWQEMRRVVGEVVPRFVFVENSAILTSRGLGCVLSDLAAMGYDAEWGVLGAIDAGLPHERERIWIVAHANEVVGEERTGALEEYGSPADESELCRTGFEYRPDLWVEMAREIHRVDDGVACKLERTEALGNGQAPRVAALAWRVLSARFQGMRVGLPKGEAVASEGRKYNDRTEPLPPGASVADTKNI